MADSSSTVATRRRIPFKIDGNPYEVDDPSQRAGDLLRLAGLDPAAFDLAVVPKEGPPRKPFEDDETVIVHKDEQFVSVRQSAPVT